MRKNRGLLAFLSILAIAGFLSGCVINIEEHCTDEDCLSCTLGKKKESGKQDDNKVTSEERTPEIIVNKVEKIVFDGTGDVYVYPGNTHRVIVTTDSNVQGLVITNVNNNILNIKYDTSTGCKPSQLRIDVYLPELTEVTLNGNGNVIVEAGYVKNLLLDIYGSGNIEAQDFTAENITVNHFGSGNAKIWAEKTVNGSISGSGNIFYRGNPVVNIELTGHGYIKRL